jgi:ABC-2 type transport system ATP-binding protein
MATSANASSSTSHPRVHIANLAFAHRNKTVLHDISFQVHAGEIFGIFGPNGSGKSTLLQCLSGLWPISHGVAHSDGQTIRLRQAKWRKRLGVVFQTCSLDPWLTVSENLHLTAMLHGIPAGEARTRIQDLLQFMQIAQYKTTQVRLLSGGFQRRVDLARALVHKPDILILDEPSQGLDVRAFQQLWQQLEYLCQHHGLTLIFSTHRADEGEYCQRIMILEHGQIVTIDTPNALLANIGGDVLTVETPQPQELCKQIELKLGLHGTTTLNQAIFTCQRGHQYIPRIVDAGSHLPIHAISLRKPSLAHVFFHLTGKALLQQE